MLHGAGRRTRGVVLDPVGLDSGHGGGYYQPLKGGSYSDRGLAREFHRNPDVRVHEALGSQSAEPPEIPPSWVDPRRWEPEEHHADDWRRPHADQVSGGARSECCPRGSAAARRSRRAGSQTRPQEVDRAGGAAALAARGAVEEPMGKDAAKGYLSCPSCRYRWNWKTREHCFSCGNALVPSPPPPWRQAKGAGKQPTVAELLTQLQQHVKADAGAQELQALVQAVAPPAPAQPARQPLLEKTISAKGVACRRAEKALEHAVRQEDEARRRLAECSQRTQEAAAWAVQAKTAWQEEFRTELQKARGSTPGAGPPPEAVHVPTGSQINLSQLLGEESGFDGVEIMDGEALDLSELEIGDEDKQRWLALKSNMAVEIQKAAALDMRQVLSSGELGIESYMRMKAAWDVHNKLIHGTGGQPPPTSAKQSKQNHNDTTKKMAAKRTAALIADGSAAAADGGGANDKEIKLEVQPEETEDPELQAFLQSEKWKKLQAIITGKVKAAGAAFSGSDDIPLPQSPETGKGEGEHNEPVKRAFDELSEEETKLLFESKGDYATFQGKLREMAKKQRYS
ncbi:unnamed protein product [Prorocentrum cordatum]|uniref:RanBP2-type domain-containing protein n=1 Tax=Prorocentrum cordatum TaxID=2364126 RepID=A0ABN9Q7B5_9DINO|nr:unnamed protein product [Polarella glacialis]